MHLHEDIKRLFKVVDQIGTVIIPYENSPNFLEELTREADHERWVIICRPDFDNDERFTDSRIIQANDIALKLSENSERIFKFYKEDYNKTTLSSHYDKFNLELQFDIRDYLIIICCQ